jgi:hypothetical protein
MLPLPAGKEARSGVGAARYARHRPERTLLYRLVEEYYPAFKAHLADQGGELPGYVAQEFENYLKCGRLEHRFLRVRCNTGICSMLLFLSRLLLEMQSDKLTRHSRPAVSVRYPLENDAVFHFIESLG